MVFGEPYVPSLLSDSIMELGVEVRLADPAVVPLLREQVRMLIDYHRAPDPVTLHEGQLYRAFLWYALVSATSWENEFALPSTGFHVPFDGDVYIMADDPRPPVYVVDAALIRGAAFDGLDIYITPVRRPDWVWIGTHDLLGPFFLENPEDLAQDPKSFA
jgi:hypothetical protein